MTRKQLLLLFIILAHAIGTALAVPADPTPVVVVQPDGSRLTISLRGDEYLSFYTTADGYTILKGDDGYWFYADIQNGQLTATQRRAHDVPQRTAEEQAWLTAIGKTLVPQMSAKNAQERSQEMQQRRNARKKLFDGTSIANIKDFTGLIILVEYNDQPFSDGFTAFARDMADKENYTGYDDTYYGRFTGSVRDYFRDNSNGQFTPRFNVVGPVKIDYSRLMGRHHHDVTTRAAILAAQDLIDFSQYAHNGEVDMIYFIFSGHDSSYPGNNEELLWAHASNIYDPDNELAAIKKRDGVTFGRYACSTELLGQESTVIRCGIGTICHEFSHLLGLPDLYDINYADDGQSVHPHKWSVMAGGNHLNNGRTPCGYGLYERYAAGFAKPGTINMTGMYTLREINSSNTGFRINSGVENEFFLLENRQQTSKWDKYLPGHGMLVFRVDSTDASIWTSNNVNRYASRNYYEMLRAVKGELDDSGFPKCLGSDPFPGSYGVTTLNNTSSPANLLSFTGKWAPWGISRIEEKDGVITFKISDESKINSITLSASSLLLNVGKTGWIVATTEPVGVSCTITWTSSNPAVATVNNQGKVTAIAPGKTVISAVVNGDNSLKATCEIEVIGGSTQAGGYGMKYWFDDQQELAGQIDDFNATLNLDVSMLSDGLHTLHVAIYNQGTGTYQESSAQTYYFIKEPDKTAGNRTEYTYFLDGQQIGQSASNQGVLHETNLNVQAVAEGLHTLTTIAKTPGEDRTTVSNQFFLRVPTTEELGTIRLTCRIAEGPVVTLKRNFENNELSYDLDVSDLPPGLHRLTYKLSGDVSSLSTPAMTEFFMIDAKVTAYEYWLNGDRSTLTTATVTNPTNPYELAKSLTMKKMPVRSKVFHFAVESGKPVVYPVNDLTIRFTDNGGASTDSTVQYIDATSKEAVTAVTPLKKSEATTVTAPAAGSIKWFSLEANRGDGIRLQASRPCAMQLFAPDGKEIYKVSGDAAQTIAGTNGRLTGTYYVALHDISDTEGGSDITVTYHPGASILIGDANGDGKITITDAVAVVDYILGQAITGFRPQQADVNGDGNVNITDAVGIIDIILRSAVPL